MKVTTSQLRISRMMGKCTFSLILVVLQQSARGTPPHKSSVLSAEFHLSLLRLTRKKCRAVTRGRQGRQRKKRGKMTRASKFLITQLHFYIIDFSFSRQNLSLIVLLPSLAQGTRKRVESQICPTCSPPGLPNLIFLLLLVIAFGTPDFIESLEWEQEENQGKKQYVQWFVMTTIVLLTETLANWPS